LQKLYLVGFTTDLRGLVLSRQKGVKSGGFVVDLDEQLRAALEEAYRRHKGGGSGGDPVPARIAQVPPEPEKPPERVAGESRPRKKPGRGVLTPKEIQAELRSGKSVEEVAQMAGTDASWIERFLGPILAERKGIVVAVMTGFISRPRRGKSSSNVGQAIVANLKERKVTISPEDLEDRWSVGRNKGHWEVTFHYSLRGQDKHARFAYDPESGVTAMDTDASVIGWRPPASKRAGDAEGRPEGEPSAAPQAPMEAAAAAKPRTKPKAAPRREIAVATAALWGATKVTPPTAPARRSNFIGVGKADAASGPSKPAAKSPAKAGGRAKPVQPVQPAKRLPGVADDRPVFARNSSSPRPKRLITVADDEEDWRSELAKTRAKRKGSVQGPGTQPAASGPQAGARAPRPGPAAPKPSPPGPAQTRAQNLAQPARPQRKRLPDDWLTGE
jgi:hypothetical protein